jgi:hypothetical protein
MAIAELLAAAADAEIGGELKYVPRRESMANLRRIVHKLAEHLFAAAVYTRLLMGEAGRH